MEIPSVDSPELNAFESFLALNPDHIQQFLELPLCDFRAHIDSLGFVGATVLEEFFSIQSFDPEALLSSAGLSLDDFLSLTPLQFMERSPDFGAPLVYCILNSIHLDGDHQQLLATAGGTNLTKSEKWAIGGAAAITGLYLLPKLYMHRKLIPILEMMAGKNPAGGGKDYDWTSINFKGFSLENSPLKGLDSAAVKRGFWGPQADLNFKTFGDRLVFELRCTLPGVIKTFYSARKQAAQAALENQARGESLEYLSNHESGFDANVERSIDDPREEAEEISQQGISQELGSGNLQLDLDNWAANQQLLGHLSDHVSAEIDSAVASVEADGSFLEREELNLLEDVVKADAAATRSLVVSDLEGLDVEIAKRANSVINVEIDSLVDGAEAEVADKVQSAVSNIEDDIKADFGD